MKELAIGEEAVINGYRIKCVEDTHYKDCFNNCFLRGIDDIGCDSIFCVSSQRADGKNVHFELVEE